MAPTTEEAAHAPTLTIDAAFTADTSASVYTTGASTSDCAAAKKTAKADDETPSTDRTEGEAATKEEHGSHADPSTVERGGDVEMTSAPDAAEVKPGQEDVEMTPMATSTDAGATSRTEDVEMAPEQEIEIPPDSEKEASLGPAAEETAVEKAEESNSANEKTEEQTQLEKGIATGLTGSKSEESANTVSAADPTADGAEVSATPSAEPEKTPTATVRPDAADGSGSMPAASGEAKTDTKLARGPAAAVPAVEASTCVAEVKTEEAGNKAVKHSKQPTAVVHNVEKQTETTESSPAKQKESVDTPSVNGFTAESSAAELAPTEPAAKKHKLENAATAATDKAETPEAPKDATAASEGMPLAAVLSRDDMAKMEEDGGLLKFDVITNDGTPEHMMQLTTLKNIFAKQLPKMPKEYIVRLVFDRNHRSMLILKNGKHVIGGICYRPFEPNHFAEIAFCAINASDQVKGYGTRLMNHLKEYVKTKGTTHFLTYADNYAIGYFKKQGFSKVVSMPRPNWYGYIKDYDGGTLMECTIHYQINYLRITSMIHMQRKAIQEKIKQQSHAHHVYPGLSKFADGRLMDIYMVPGVKEAGWSQAVIRNNRIGTRDQGSLKTQLLQLVKAVSNHRSAWPFHEPVDTTIVVDYLDHIKNPVDLQLISKRVESGAYMSKAAFKADLDLMCANCMMYNTPDTNYYKAAKDLQEFIGTRIQIREQFSK